MRITFAQLEAFVWVARLGTVQEAARHLNLTQPTISLRLRDLADMLGKPMFYREGRHLKLSVDGLNVLDHAARIIEEAEKIIDKTSAGSVNGLVRMGMSEAIALAGLSSLLTDLAGRYPNLRLETVIGTSTSLHHDLHEGTLDLAIGIDFHENERIRVIPLGVQEAAWIARPGLNLPDPITPSDILHLPILTNPNPTPMYRQTMNWFHSAQLEPQKISVSDSINVVAHLVKVGIGLAILPRKLIEQEISSGLLVSLSCKPKIEQSHMSIAYRINDWRPAVNAVVEATRDMLERLDWLAY